MNLKRILILFLIIYIANINLFADNSKHNYSIKDIEKITPIYLDKNPSKLNPVFVDIDNDDDFDLLEFNDGKVALYSNIGTKDNPEFILENENYDSYQRVFFIEPKIPYPIFFADSDNDGDLDLFAVKDYKYNKNRLKSYTVSYAENSIDIDTGTLVTIILILVIILLVLAILK
jgi:hypothetical protein